ncbi:hypothetical protein GCM10020367_67450 [Streptomyces sannanensis]|uniref:Alpha/beta hydrolase n=1 Tax=Streptomyces sannanensis TaxID=285536 RepID=A0ABP6SMW5_9ACTN
MPPPPVTHGGTTDSGKPRDPCKAERDRFIVLLHGLSFQGWSSWIWQATMHPRHGAAGDRSLRVDSVNVLRLRVHESRAQQRAARTAVIPDAMPAPKHLPQRNGRCLDSVDFPPRQLGAGAALH